MDLRVIRIDQKCLIMYVNLKCFSENIQVTLMRQKLCGSVPNASTSALCVWLHAAIVFSNVDQKHGVGHYLVEDLKHNIISITNSGLRVTVIMT